MDAMSLVDPELRQFAEMMQQRPETTEADIAERRKFYAVGFQAVRQADDLPIVEEERFVPGPEGAPQIRVLLYTPIGSEKPMPAVLHIHGGGYVVGAPEMNYASSRRLAVELGCVIVSVDYRLAPETRFPGALEDCYAALTWLHAQADALGVDRSRIAVMGESAGGGLAAALALFARDRGDVKLIALHLNAPMIDDRTPSLPDPHPYAGMICVTRTTIDLGWRCLLGHSPGQEKVSPYAAPARAENLADLPPTYLTIGALDLFLEEVLDYARRLTRAGVPVELHVYPGAFHAFEAVQSAAVTQRSLQDMKDALRRAFSAIPA
jgi:acetyl esterase/lipase